MARRSAVPVAGLVGVAGIVASLANMGFHFVVARGGGPASYGAIGVLIPVGTIAAFLALGTEYTVARIAILHRGTPGQLLRRSLSTVWPWLLVGALLLALSGPISAYLHLSSYVPVALADFVFCAVMINAVATGILFGSQLFPAIILLQVVSAFIRLGGGAALGRGSDPITGAMTATVIPAVAVAAIGFLLAGRVRRGGEAGALPAADRLKSVTGEGVSRALLAACLWVVWSLPLAFSRHELGPVQAGGFAAAQLLASGIVFASATFVQTFYPRVMRRPSARIVIIGAAATIGIAAAGSVALTLLGPAMITHLFGTGFSIGAGGLVALSLSAAATALAIFGLWMVRAMRRYVFVAYLGIAASLPAEIVVGALWHDGPVALALGPAVALAAGLLGVLVASTVIARRIPRPFNLVIDAARAHQEPA